MLQRGYGKFTGWISFRKQKKLETVFNLGKHKKTIEEY
jgi:hypothetical protein